MTKWKLNWDHRLIFTKGLVLIATIIIIGSGCTVSVSQQDELRSKSLLEQLEVSKARRPRTTGELATSQDGIFYREIYLDEKYGFGKNTPPIGP